MRELNAVDGLWTTRITSHVALKDVAGLISEEEILEAVRLLHDAIADTGVERPRLAVAALNPHAGDDGNFGREEIDIIAPAVARGESGRLRRGRPVASGQRSSCWARTAASMGSWRCTTTRARSR